MTRIAFVVQPKENSEQPSTKMDKFFYDSDKCRRESLNRTSNDAVIVVDVVVAVVAAAAAFVVVLVIVAAAAVVVVVAAAFVVVVVVAAAAFAVVLVIVAAAFVVVVVAVFVLVSMQLTNNEPWLLEGNGVRSESHLAMGENATPAQEEMRNELELGLAGPDLKQGSNQMKQSSAEPEPEPTQWFKP